MRLEQNKAQNGMGHKSDWAIILESDDEVTRLSDALRKRRLTLGLSQAEFVRGSGVSSSWLSKIETRRERKVNLPFLISLCEHHNLDPYSLVPRLKDAPADVLATLRQSVERVKTQERAAPRKRRTVAHRGARPIVDPPTLAIEPARAPEPQHVVKHGKDVILCPPGAYDFIVGCLVHRKDVQALLEVLD